jgi:tetratricopeptide (TPR) repeat protein
MRLNRPADAAHDCAAAVEANPSYTKAYLRRSAAYEELDDVERALSDAQKALELAPGSAAAAGAAARLAPVVEARREAMKEEMMGKLKELGNTVLGKFGLSLDNFKAEQDPATGGYSIKFG